MQLLCLGYPDRGSPGRKESGPTTAPTGGYARPARFQGRLRMLRDAERRIWIERVGRCMERR